jgi:hypothetical protein
MGAKSLWKTKESENGAKNKLVPTCTSIGLSPTKEKEKSTAGRTGKKMVEKKNVKIFYILY